jgi:hypothetical protein
MAQNSRSVSLLALGLWFRSEWFDMATDRHLKELAALIDDNARRYRRHEVFRDFCELAALSISNAVDKHQYDGREARYMDIIKRYTPEEAGRFSQMLGCLVLSLERDMKDALGAIFMSLELGDAFKGQFFTPYELSKLLAHLTLDDAAAHIERRGYITLSEPACGAGSMVIACAETLREQDINYQTKLHVTAVDVDSTAVHMAYVQLALLHIPAIVVHGNSLTLKTYGHWVTPAHVLGLWDHKLRRDEAVTAPHEEEVTTPSIETIRTEVVATRIEQLSLFG